MMRIVSLMEVKARTLEVKVAPGVAETILGIIMQILKVIGDFRVSFLGF
jgi:hypothetical protein